MKKLLSMLAIAAMTTTTFTACDSNENENPAGPTITAPGASSVQVGTSADITFDVTAPGGFSDYTVSATGGSVVKKSEPAQDATSGEVVVTFTADETAGDATVEIEVTDNNSQTSTSTATITKTEVPVPDEIDVTGQITEDQTWTADNIYILEGRVIVTNGATLTIEAGTVIKGQEGEAANASVLMIARDGSIDAQGTAENPIIMTSILDDVMPGQVAGSTLNEDDRGLWGGLVLLGSAPISVNGATEKQIEGVPAGETLGLYGGDEADDNSGTVTYVSIRHGGAVLGPDSEINGLTLGGVGSGTTINNIEIFANSDDGVEFFGGTVNVDNIVVAYQGDDAIDIDQAYSGTVDGFMIIHGGDTDEAFEIDGPEGTANADGMFVLMNGMVVGDASRENDKASLGDFKSKAQGTLQNVKFSGYPEGKNIKIAASYDETNCSVGKANAFSNLIADDLVFTTVEFENYGVSVYNSAATSTEPGCAIPAADQTAAEGKITSTAVTTGLPALTLWDWTVASSLELLD